jgi:hypothetical protein
MEKKIISLPTDGRKIYRQILAFMNFMLNLSPQERDVLAEIIRLDNEYSVLPDDKRAKFILSTDSRKEICQFTNIESKQFAVILSKLKKKSFMGTPILDESNKLNQHLRFKPDQDGFRFEVSFVMTEIKKNQSIEEELIQQYPLTPDESFPIENKTPVEYQHDASKAEVIEEQQWDFTISNPNEG